MSVPGFPEAMVALLGHGSGARSATDTSMGRESPAAEDAALPATANEQLAADLLTEVSWVLAYLTAGAEAHLNRMVALGIVPPLVAHLVWCSQQVSAALRQWISDLCACQQLEAPAQTTVKQGFRQ